MLTITVQGVLEDRLLQAARLAKADPQALAESVLDAHLPASNQRSMELLTKWEQDEATTDPAEIARRQSEGEQFMESLAANRTASDGGEARKLWP